MLLAVVSFGLVGASAPAQAANEDFAEPGASYNVLPPGNGFLNADSTDQIPLYDGLTPLKGNVGPGDLSTYFKTAQFGLPAGETGVADNPPARPGVTVVRDSYGVPHINGQTRDDVMYGAGWATAKDRSLLLTAFRGAGYIAALDAPGYDTFALAEGLASFAPTQQTLDFLEKQEILLKRQPRGKRILQDIDMFIAGINAAAPNLSYKREDVLGAAAFVGATFGKGGGDEARASQLLGAFQSEFGATEGRQIWDELSSKHDKDVTASIHEQDGTFPYGRTVENSPGNAIVDNGSITSSASTALKASVTSRRYSSNAVLVGAQQSATGKPFMVAGPQTGYFHPEVLYEMDLHGGGVDSRGVTFPGVAPYVLMGRGMDFSWSATSAGNDVVDIVVEKLCGGDNKHYVYRGRCRAMKSFDAGTLNTGPLGNPPNQVTQVTFDESIHGPVLPGSATVGGETVRFAVKRSTRGREALSAFGFADLNTNTVKDPKTFFKAADKIEMTFNWTYSDHENIALFSSGRLPVRHPAVDSGLPAWGTGKFEWRRFLKRREHPQVVNPSIGQITNWNNGSAVGFGANDANWTYGPVYRSSLLDQALADTKPGGGHTLASTVAAMNKAATQDLRVREVWPEIDNLLDEGSAPSPRAAQMRSLLQSWRADGGHRLDLDNNGTVDDPGAIIMDRAWAKLADAVMGGKLTPALVSQLAAFQSRNDQPGPIGSAFQGGWYSWLDKDLRNVKPLGPALKDPWDTKFCGSGNQGDCADDLWAALEQAGNELASEQGANPADWRANATSERIQFRALPPTCGGSPCTMRWTNRPTFQQAMSYDGHR